MTVREEWVVDLLAKKEGGRRLSTAAGAPYRTGTNRTQTSSSTDPRSVLRGICRNNEPGAPGRPVLLFTPV